MYPRTHQYSVSFQREIGWKNVLEVNYIGRQGRNLFGGYDVNQVDYTKNGFLADFEQLRTTGNSPRINQLLAGHSGLLLVNGVRETGSQFLLRQTLAGQVRLPNGTLTSNLVAAGGVAQAAFLIAQSTQGTFAGTAWCSDSHRERIQPVLLPAVSAVHWRSECDRQQRSFTLQRARDSGQPAFFEGTRVPGKLYTREV